MVIYYVHDHRDTACVALVDELLVLLACSVIQVKGEPVIRVISPAEVAVKLLDRHELDSIHTEVLDVVELSHRTGDVL